MSSLGIDVALDQLRRTVATNPQAVQAALAQAGSTQPATPDGVLLAYAEKGDVFEAALWQQLNPNDRSQVEDTGRKILRLVLQDGTEYLRKKGLNLPGANQPTPTPATATTPGPAPFNWKPWALGGGITLALVVVVLFLRP